MLPTLLILVTLYATPAAPVVGKVIRVSDGDTITVVMGQKETRVRLHAIDAPERTQPYSRRATEALKSRVLGKQVTIQKTDIDRYGRTVAWVYVDGENVNEWMVASGWAWHFRRYSDSPRLDRLEWEARESSSGLWAWPKNMQPPWEFRAEQRRARARGEDGWCD